MDDENNYLLFQERLCNHIEHSRQTLSQGFGGYIHIHVKTILLKKYHVFKMPQSFNLIKIL